MKIKTSTLYLIAAVATSTIAWASEPYALFVEPKVGESQRVRVKADLDIGGAKVVVDYVHRKTTEAVEPGVAFKQKTTVESIRLLIDGEEVEADAPDHIMVSNADGSFRGSLEPHNDIYSYKNSLLTVVHLSPGRRAVGDKWVETRPADSKLGTTTVKQAFEFVEVEEVAGAPCAKVDFVIEDSSEEVARHTGTVWVNLKTLERVKARGEYFNIPWSGSPARASGKYEIDVIDPRKS